VVTNLLTLYSVTVVGWLPIGKPPDYELILLLLLPVVYIPRMHLHPVDTFVNVRTYKKTKCLVYAEIFKCIKNDI